MLSQAVVRALHKKQKLSAVVLQAAAMFPELGRATANSTIPYVIDLKEIVFLQRLVQVTGILMEFGVV